MIKKCFLGLVIFFLLFIITGCVLNEKINLPKLPVEDIIQTGQDFFQETATDTEVLTETETIDEQTDLYSVKASYPQIKLTDEEIAQTINEELENLVLSEINNFKEAALESGESPLPEVISSIEIGYKIDYLDENLLSLHFTVSTYMAGAAHPYSYSVVYNYDIANDWEIELADLFYEDSNYVEKISEIAQSDLEQKLADNFLFKEGVAPDEENFENFVLEADSVKILFDPYAVAPYAAGPQEVEIKYQEIKDLFDPEGPIGYLVSF
jgi:hypothetical protein